MKKTFLFFAGMLALAFASCTQEESNADGYVKPAASSAVENLTANFGSGSMTVSTTGYSKKRVNAPKSRALGDYTGEGQCGNFASDAAAVTNPYSAEAAPAAVPKDAESANGFSSYNGKPLVAGKTYYIDNSFNFWGDLGFVSGEGDVTIYVTATEGQTIAKIPSNSIVKIMPGAKVKITTYGLKEIDNWGTLIYGADINEGCIVKNYNVFDDGGNNVKVAGTLYSSTDLNLKRIESTKNTSEVYVDGNLACSSNGLQGKLYVKDEWSGDININVGLAARVGSVNTNGGVVISAGGQLMVEGDVKAASVNLNGSVDDWSTGSRVVKVSEMVVKGKAEVSGLFNTASGSKGYVELLECENYTANASDIWVGCKSVVREKFELNGNSKFTLANGVYLEAGEAVFASNTKMEMMSKSFFNVKGKLQLNNADNNNLNGSGSELAIVKAKTMGANYQDFEKTFTGNIGVEFEAWDYNSSTGLIDQNVNLKRMSDLADAYKITASDCNPGYTGSKVKEDPTQETKTTTYTVRYVTMGEDGVTYEDLDESKNIVNEDGEVGQVVNVGDEYEILEFSGYDAPTSVADKTLVEDPANNIIYVVYTKKETIVTPPTPAETDGCDMLVELPLDVKKDWIVQADDFAIHNGDILYENIAANTDDSKDAVADTGHNSQKNYVVVNGEKGEKVTIKLSDVCAMYEDYKKKPNYVSEDGTLTLEVYLWPGTLENKADEGEEPWYTFVPIPAKDYGVTADGVDGKYILGAENVYEMAEVGSETKYEVKYQAYMSYNGGGNGAAMTSYVKVSFHISPKTK